MGLAIDPEGRFYVSEIVSNAPLLRVDPVTGATTKLFDTGVDLIHGLQTAPAPVIRPSTSFQHTAVFRDKRASFTVSATGIAPLAYQWRRDGQELSGQTNKTLTIAAVQPTDEGNYTVEVSNPDGSAVSPAARLWVVPPTSDFGKGVFTNTVGKRVPYVYHLPANYNPARRYPLVCMVHGGEANSGWNQDNIPAGFADWPQWVCITSYRQQATEPVIAVYPTHRAGIGWESSLLPEYTDFLDQLATAFNADPNRIHVIWGSGSGPFVFELLARRPNFFASATLSAGVAGHPPPVKIKDAPLWVHHARDDSAVSVTVSRSLIAALRAAGGRPIYTEYNTGNHEPTLRALLSTPELWEWRLAQRLGQRTDHELRLAISRPTDAGTLQTGGVMASLAGSLEAYDGDVTQVTWENRANQAKGRALGMGDWNVAGIPLAPDKTNVVIVTATLDTGWIPALGGTTTFSDTLSVFSTPVRLSLTARGGQATLDWTGGVPPFSVQRTQAWETDIAGWTEIATGAMPPISVPARSAAEFYRVVGQ